MKKQRDYRVQESVQLATRPVCLNCGTLLDGAACVEEGEPREHRPKADDITVCIKCGHVMAYADEGALRELTEAEMCEIAGDERILAIQRARKAFFP
jgi:hypothetical protein